MHNEHVEAIVLTGDRRDVNPEWQSCLPVLRFGKTDGNQAKTVNTLEADTTQGHPGERVSKRPRTAVPNMRARAVNCWYA